MNCSAVTSPGALAAPNEDWHVVTPELVVVLDGATIRTDTGCSHGAAWYVRRLGEQLAMYVPVIDVRPLGDVLGFAIDRVAALHPQCDLDHPGTPSAAVAIVHRCNDHLRYLVLGDISIVVETDRTSDMVITDQRVSATATAQREEVDSWPIGSPEKAAALIPMKHAELAARNVEGGYWIAAADSTAADHAVTGEIPVEQVKRFAVLTDGAARYVDLFGLGCWRDVLGLLDDCGPVQMIDLVRSVEDHDPLGIRYPRNKRHDDATVVFAQLARTAAPVGLAPVEERRFVAEQFLATTMNAPGVMGDGMLHALR